MWFEFSGTGQHTHFLFLFSNSIVPLSLYLILIHCIEVMNQKSDSICRYKLWTTHRTLSLSALGFRHWRVQWRNSHLSLSCQMYQHSGVIWVLLQHRLPWRWKKLYRWAISQKNSNDCMTFQGIFLLQLGHHYQQANTHSPAWMFQ